MPQTPSPQLVLPAPIQWTRTRAFAPFLCPFDGRSAVADACEHSLGPQPTFDVILQANVHGALVAQTEADSREALWWTFVVPRDKHEKRDQWRA